MAINITIPEQVYTDAQFAGNFLIGLKARRARLDAAVKDLKAAEDAVSEAMLVMLSASGQKHFAFEFGTFTRKTQDHASFPLAEAGGKAAALEWLEQCVDKGVISKEDILSVQQTRINTAAVKEIEAAVAQYNESNPQDPIPESPFIHFTKETLSSPRPKGE